MKEEIEMETMHVFIAECQYDGFRRTLVDPEEKEIFDRLDNYTYSCDVTVPVISEDKKRDMAISAIDNEIADKQVGINHLIEKKSQLLALTHNPDEEKYDLDEDLPF